MTPSLARSDDGAPQRGRTAFRGYEVPRACAGTWAPWRGLPWGLLGLGCGSADPRAWSRPTGALDSADLIPALDEHWATHTGLAADGGLGTSLAWSGGELWMGAPFGAAGQILRVDTSAGATSELVLEGAGLLGWSLAATPEGVVVGAPLAGQVLSSTGEVQGDGASGLGLALVGTPSGWVAAHHAGWIDASGGGANVEGPPSDVAWLDDEVWVGTALGPTALSPAGAPHPAPHDEAGFALAADPVSGGVWVGAPQTASVHLVRRDGSVVTTLRGAGRFGAALDLVAHEEAWALLAVGAPLDGPDQAGTVSVLLVRAGQPPELWATLAAPAPGDEFGTSVAWSEAALAVGAPGRDHGRGAVELYR